MPRLKNWSVRSDFSSLNQLWGNVYGHPRFEDGKLVSTSYITDIKEVGDHKEVTTFSGSVYHLYKEDVDPEAEKQFPGYYERLSMKP